MKQLTQKLKDGKVMVTDVPMPQLGTGMLLIRNHFSLISSGTEGSTVKTARKGLIGKAKERPQQVKQVLDVLKSQGVTQTVNTVRKKLESLSPLGYSCVGEVIEIGSGIADFAVGDYVACGGITASHADVVSVSANLCVKVTVDEGDDVAERLRAAAYNTLGAIAMQGVRQADTRLGETCAVIGLGLLGQITCQLLRASGARVIGFDINPTAVDTAQKHSADLALLMGQVGIEELVHSFTHGLGVDAVIITASASDTGPINFAGAISRKRGRVVVVGAVPTGFDRDPHYYRKELDLRMSCSYGPGRYDPDYEEKGLDYPPAYVRWTENRNMAAFQELLRAGAINMECLTTHEFELEDAPKAYDMILSGSEPSLGVLIRYDVSRPVEQQSIQVRDIPSGGLIRCAFVGAGSYAQGSLLPNLPSDENVVRANVLTQSGTTSRSVTDRFGFAQCSSNKDDIFDNNDINTVFISTRHDSHAAYVVDALKTEKHTFVDKPLCLTEEELVKIQRALEGQSSPSQLFVGYNRRFAPLALKLKSHFSEAPMAMVYRVNAGAIPGDHWIQDPEIGGGRIIGEVCHFVDFMTWMNGSLPKSVHAIDMTGPDGLNDNVILNLEFENGSVGSVIYMANGGKSLPKEYFEVFQHGKTGVLDDFGKITIHGNGRPVTRKGIGQDKGQKNMLKAFLEGVQKHDAPMSDIAEIFAVSRATFCAMESIRTGEMVRI